MKLFKNNLRLCTMGLAVWACSHHEPEPDKAHPNAAAPFAKSKILFSTSFTAQFTKASALDSSTVLAKGTAFTFIVDDVCLMNRRSSTGPKIPHFIDKYLPANFNPPSNQNFPHTGIDLSLQNPITYGDLVRATFMDNCIVGATDQTKTPLKTMAAYSDPSYSGQSNYLQAINFEAGDAVFKAEIASNIKVVTAFIDTGFDMKNPDIGPLSPNLFGSNIVGDGSADIPQDTFGHGTNVASLVTAVGGNSVGMVGIAHRNAVMLPLRLIPASGAAITSGALFNSVKQAVNAGAEVINMSIGYNGGQCAPYIGQALYEAIERNVFVVMSAGNGISVDGPGMLYSPKENGSIATGATHVPACWGRYFKGSLAVANLTTGTNTIDPSSNWGTDAVEIAAPGSNILTWGLGKMENMTGTSASAALVTAAVVDTIAYHKAKGWDYTPWLIEDVLLNGSPSISALASPPDGRGVRLGKVLDLQNLANYLKGRESLTADQRLHETSDNPQEGTGLNPGNTGNGSFQRLQIYTKTPMIKNTERAQFQAVAYYDNGSLRVVTNETTWTSLDTSKAAIDSSGIVHPVAGALGSVNIQANFNFSTVSSVIVLSNTNLIAGMLSDLTNLEIIPPSKMLCCFEQGDLLVPFKLLAHYADGSTRDVTQAASWVAENPSEFPSRMSSNKYDAEVALGGKTYRITAMYQGQSASLDVTMPLVTLSNLHVESDNSTVRRGAVPILRLAGTLNSINGTEPVYDTQFEEMTFSSTDPVMDAALKSVGHSTDSVPAGTYPVQISAIFRGSGKKEVVTTPPFNLTIVEPKPIAIKFDSPGHTSYVFGTGNTFAIDMVYDDGETSVLAGKDISNLAITLQNTQGQVPPKSEVAYVLDHYEMLLLDGNEGDSFTLNVNYIPLNFKTSLTFTVHGINSYVGGPSSTQPVLAKQNPPAVPANPSYCTADKIAAKSSAGGSGSQSDPYLICSSQQLFAIHDLANNPSSLAYFKLMHNIDLSSYANLAQNQIASDFGFNFDGNNLEIQNLTMIDAEKTALGLFNGAVVSNLGLRNVNIRGKYRVAPFGYVTYIKNSYVVGGQVWGTSNISGLADLNGGGGSPQNRWVVDNCFVQGVTVSFEDTYAGGLVDQIGGMGGIRASWADVTVSFVGVPGNGSVAGGLVGTNGSGWIIGSYSTGSVKSSGTEVGGLAGENSGRIINSWSSADVVSQSGEVGGLVGEDDGDGAFGLSDYSHLRGLIFGSFATGSVSGSQSDVGGLVGRVHSAIIENSYSTGSVSGLAPLGGLVGHAKDLNTFRNDSSTSKVTSSSGGNTNTGGFIGWSEGVGQNDNVPDFYINSSWSKTANSSLHAIGQLFKIPNQDPAGLTAK